MNGIGEKEEGLYVLKTKQQHHLQGIRSLIIAKECDSDDICHKILGNISWVWLEK